jgi:vancomycin resistance protein YoaR
MTQEAMQRLLKKKFDDMYQYAEQYTETQEQEYIIKFKADLKSIRSIIDTIKIHKGERAVQFGEASKKMYNTAGFIVELIEEMEVVMPDILQVSKQAQLQEQMEQAKNDWKRVYSKAGLGKLEKVLMDYDYTKLPLVVVSNFIKRYQVELQ